MDKPERSYAQVEQVERMKVDKKVSTTVYVNYKHEGSIYLLDVMTYENAKIVTNKPICIVLWKMFATTYCFSF